MRVTSTANAQVKAIRKLRERKYRQETNSAYLEGIRLVLEALARPELVETLIVAPELLQSDKAGEALQMAEEGDTPLFEVSAAVFTSFALKDHPQGLAAVVKQSWSGLEWLSRADLGLWVGLDSVADPGNLGTIMRTADAVGARGLILIDNCTAPYDPAALRGSMGAVFSLELVKTTTPQFLAWKDSQKVPVYGTSDSAAADYQRVKYPPQMLLLMGSERQGLHPELAACCDKMVAIPMAGRSDSLNLAVATAVMLYEVYNQHRKKGAA